MHCLYRSNMHVLVSQAGGSAAVIYGDSDNEVQQELPLGMSGVTSGLWWGHGGRSPAPKASVGPQGLEEVSLSLHCLVSLTGV